MMRPYCCICTEKKVLVIRWFFLLSNFFLSTLFCIWFQVYSLLVRESYALHSVPLDISSAHLAPYTVITILLTVFPMVYLHPHDYFVTANPSCSIPSPFHPIPRTLFPPATTIQLSVSMSLFQFSLFIYFVLEMPRISEITWYLSFFLWLTSFIVLSRSIHAVTNSKISFFLTNE